MNDMNSLSHSKWRCKYHIVFAPKYRRQVIYGDIRKDIGVILRKLCEQKNVEIVEAELCQEYIHMLVSIPPNMSVSQFVGYLKGKSSLMIFDRHANLKYKYGNRHFWCRGYYVDTVGKNEKKIAEYIREQLQSDMMEDQISMKKFVAPFAGGKNNQTQKQDALASVIKRLRVYISPAEHLRDSAYYEFLADFENPYLAGKYMAHLRLNEKYREQDIILGEIFAKKTEAGEIITKGDVVAVLSTMGEYLPLEEYEFT